ncbi:MAG: PBSX family phage terminase large subunit [Dehalobacter sp.]|nr:PBSX family phage terminase large subunit [Dehalobacter sp.]
MLKKIKRAVFKFHPFSLKQKKVLTWWCDDSPVKDKDGIIADGAIRSGKTISMALSFVMWAMYQFNDQNFGMCGKTIGSFRRNVVFWLKIILRCRGYRVEDKRADNLLIVYRGDKVNFFYIFGGKDERSQDLIQGITLAGILFDEVALMPESFVKQGTGRCSVEGSKFWFNCNPQGPYHWFKLEWIDKRKEKNLLYLHFTMDDNLSLSEKMKDRYRRMYAGVFFKRYILGLWVMAEGIIYDMFNEDAHKVPTTDRAYTEFYVCGDYGTQNPTTFGLWGKSSGKWYKVKEYYYSGRDQGKQKTDEEFYQDLDKFIGNIKVRAVIVDPSAASFIATIKKHDKFRVKPAKNDVLEGIRNVATALNNMMIFYNDCCINTFREFYSYIWDDKAAERGEDKPSKQNDHCMDGDRYFVNTILFRGPGLQVMK